MMPDGSLLDADDADILEYAERAALDDDVDMQLAAELLGDGEAWLTPSPRPAAARSPPAAARPGRRRRASPPSTRPPRTPEQRARDTQQEAQRRALRTEAEKEADRRAAKERERERRRRAREEAPEASDENKENVRALELKVPRARELEPLHASPPSPRHPRLAS